MASVNQYRERVRELQKKKREVSRERERGGEERREK